MKKSMLAIIALIFSLSLATGSAFATDAKEQKLNLTNIQDNHSVKVYNDNLNGAAMPAELVDGSLYLKADYNVPLLSKWGNYPDENWSSAGFNKDGKTELIVSFGSRTFINFQGKPQQITDTMKAELQKGYFPVRFVYELAGYKVTYNPDDYSVTLK
jgi:hypothetical protein